MSGTKIIIFLSWFFKGEKNFSEVKWFVHVYTSSKCQAYTPNQLLEL